MMILRKKADTEESALPVPETLPAVRPVGLPRVNLLPPEIAEARRFRRVQAGLGGAMLAAVGVVALLYAGASGAISDAQSQVDAAAARASALRAQTAQYDNVTKVYAQAAAARSLLTQAMGQEVRWSTFLNNLSLSIPDNVWVTSIAFSQAPVAPTLGQTQPGIGTATFSGVGFQHDDVAVWLESLAGQKGYANPYFSNSAEALVGPRKVVNFTSTVTLTNDALSGRYTSQAGG